MRKLIDPDGSVNFVWSSGFEARYVRRTPGKLTVYLSSQTGCAHRCRMCHLTASKQFKATDATLSDLLEQARTVLEHYDTLPGPKAESVNFDFMARGEPLANPIIWAQAQKIFAGLGALARDRWITPHFLISTILPKSVQHADLGGLGGAAGWPWLYYSIYSIDPRFREKWLPMAMAPEVALQKLAGYQQQAGRPRVKLHWCFIEGENDHDHDVHGICDFVRSSGLKADVNIVRYNPYDETYGREPSSDRIFDLGIMIRDHLPGVKVKVVDRVGFEVKASCGMFVEDLP